MTATLQLSMPVHVAGFAPVPLAQANLLLTEWGHYLGPVQRPFGSQAWLLDGGCHGCMSQIMWRGRRSYILGVSREAWGCLFRGHHIRGREVPYMLGMCHRCLRKCPCPDCGSVAVDADGFPTHEADCGNA